MANPLDINAKYSGCTVTLGTAATAQSLIQLILAARPSAPPVCRELCIQVDPDSLGTYIKIGDAGMVGAASFAAASAGFKAGVSQSKTYGAGNVVQSVFLNEIYVIGDTTGMTLNIEMQQ